MVKEFRQPRCRVSHRRCSTLRRFASASLARPPPPPSTVSHCTNSEGGDCAYEAVLQVESHDGGYSWAPSGGGAPPSNLVAMTPLTYEYVRDNYNHSEAGFGDPSTIVRGRGGDAGHYYVLISVSSPPIGINGWAFAQQRGQCLLRTATPLDHTSWRAWDGADFTVKFANPYAEVIANASAHVCAVVNTSMILVSLSWSTRFDAWLASGFGSYTFQNGTRIPCCGAFLYSISSDLVNWGPPQLVRPAKQEGLFADWEYDGVFLDDQAGARGLRNWHDELGSEFYFYYWRAEPDRDPRARSVYRQKVTLPRAAPN